MTLKSFFAYGSRSLLKHKKTVHAVVTKACKLFGVRVYRMAICSDHIHMLVKGKRREDIQNFSRVVAGHIAQRIVEELPIGEAERMIHERSHGSPNGCKKNQRKFWAYLIYSRIVSWGRDFTNVAHYIVRNSLEALNIVAYQPRNSRTRAAPK